MLRVALNRMKPIERHALLARRARGRTCRACARIDKRRAAKHTIAGDPSGDSRPNRLCPFVLPCIAKAPRMTANPSFVRALGEPLQARPGYAGKKALVAAPPVSAVSDPRLVAGRDLPGSARAPKVASLPMPPQVVAGSAGSSVARGATLMSVALHLGLVAGWAVFAAPARPLAVPDLETAQVELISQAQFMAMTAPQPEAIEAPAPAPQAPQAPPPPEITAAPDPAPPANQPAPALAAPPAPDLIAKAEPPPESPKVEPQPAPAKAEVPKPKPQPKAEKPKAAKPAAGKPKAETPEATKTAKAERPKVADGAGGENPAARATAAGATISKGEAKALQADWGAKVRARINRKLAVPKGTAPGRAKVRVTLAPSGALLAAEVVESSGQPGLDAAALKAAKAAAPFPRAPKGLSEARYSFTVPVRQDG